MPDSLATVVVRPLGGTLGAQVDGIDIAAGLDDAAFAAVRRAWLDHLVLRFRGQREISTQRLVDFSRRFGPLDRSPITTTGTGAPYIPEHPEITAISNIEVDGKPIGGLGAFEAEWHTDMSYNEKPPTASLLYAIEIPAAGGDTWFANMYAAWDALAAPLRERVRRLSCVHDASLNSVGRLRKGYKQVTDPRETVGAVHPLVRTHPETGREALFLGRRRNAYVPGLSLQDSESLLDELWAHATRDEFRWVHRWELGDLIVWDNRCTLHRRDAFDPATRRLMHRTQVGGDRPYLAA